MNKTSLNIGVFDPILINQSSPYCGDNVFAKGLEANGYDVTRFDYRKESDPNNKLLKVADLIKPDIFWFGKCERIEPNFINILKSRFPEAIFVKWAADVRSKPTDHDMGHNNNIDWFFGTFGGDYLKAHLTPNMKGVASIITFTDSDYYKKIEDINKEYNSDILWTGRTGFGDNDIRNKVIDFLSRISNVKVKITGLKDWLGDPEYVNYINGAKIGVGANSFNRRKYTSDRMGNYISCGTFYLPHVFEGIEEVFDRGVNLDWYKDIEELKEKLELYLSDDVKREEIAKKSREFVLKYFDYKPLVKNLLYIIKHNKSKYKWDDVYIN